MDHLVLVLCDHFALHMRKELIKIAEQIDKIAIFNTPTFSESGAGKFFNALKMRAIDSAHKKTPR
jgi:hypothetical protein